VSQDPAAISPGRPAFFPNQRMEVVSLLIRLRV
jgi:hypothetical protein